MHFDPLKRPELMTLLGAAAAWPHTARAQQPAMPVIGFLSGQSPGQLVHLATRHAVHTTYSDREYVEGTKPADLPVMQTTKLELVMNGETAGMLGIIVPPALLATADEIIE
jgi:hypothetical protein